MLLSLLITSSVLAASNEKSAEWLKVNAVKEGITVLPSGLQYKVITSGSGKSKPTMDSPCVCHYNGTLINGTKFDSSYDRGSPATFAPNQVIKGWTEALQMMVVGDKWGLFIPSEIGYGDHGSPPKIGPGDALVFTLELLEIKKEPVSPGVHTPTDCDPATLEGCTIKEKNYVKITGKKVNDIDFLEDEIEEIEHGIEFYEAEDAMNGSNENANKTQWARTRLDILKKLLEAFADKDEL